MKAFHQGVLAALYRTRTCRTDQPLAGLRTARHCLIGSLPSACRIGRIIAVIPVQEGSNGGTFQCQNSPCQAPELRRRGPGCARRLPMARGAGRRGWCGVRLGANSDGCARARACASARAVGLAKRRDLRKIADSVSTSRCAEAAAKTGCRGARIT